MNRKTLLAAGAFGALLLIAILVTRAPDKGQRTGERPRPVPRLKAGDFDTLEITRGTGKTVLVKDGEKYKVTAPLAYAADDFAGKQAFEGIEKLDFDNVVSDQKSKQAEYEVTDTAVRVTVKKGAEAKADLYVGKSTGSGTMVRVVGKDDIWSVSGSLKATYDKDTAALRDKGITTFPQADAERIEIVSKAGGKIVLKKEPKPEGDKTEEPWSVVESAVKIDTLDKTIAPGVVSALAAFKANDFADGAKPEDTGLPDPQTTITVGLKGGKVVTVLVGNKKGDDDFYVKASDAPQVFLVKKYNIERINRRPIEFRDKTLCNISDADLGAIEVAAGKDDSFALGKSGSDWKASKPAGLEVDGTKVTPMANAFKDWKATNFAESQDAKAAGLAKPKAVITGKSSDKKTVCVLKIGDESKDKQSYFAQKAGSPEVYLVGKWQADRLLKKTDDLKKPGSGAKK